MRTDDVEPLPADLLALAAAQGGAFERQQALAHGVQVATLEKRRRRGTLISVRRGTYAIVQPAEPDESEAQATQRALASLRAVAAAHVLRTPGDVVISHEWAAAAYGWARVGPLPAAPSLTKPRLPGTPPDSWPGLSIAALPAAHRTTLDGLAITTQPRTLVDSARVVPAENAVVIADSALRGGCCRAEARQIVATCRRWPGIIQAREVIAFADARADSALESRTRWRLAQQGLPPPELQLTLCTEHGRDVGEVDFVWREQRTILETDGRLKYQDGAGAGDPGVLWREKLREDALRALGFVVVRGYWSDSAEQLAAKVLAGFALAATFPTAASYGYRYTQKRLEQMAR